VGEARRSCRAVLERAFGRHARGREIAERQALIWVASPQVDQGLDGLRNARAAQRQRARSGRIANLHSVKRFLGKDGVVLRDFEKGLLSGLDANPGKGARKGLVGMAGKRRNRLSAAITFNAVAEAWTAVEDLHG